MTEGEPAQEGIRIGTNIQCPSARDDCVESLGILPRRQVVERVHVHEVGVIVDRARLDADDGHVGVHDVIAAARLGVLPLREVQRFPLVHAGIGLGVFHFYLVAG